MAVKGCRVRSFIPYLYLDSGYRSLIGLRLLVQFHMTVCS